MSSVEIYSPNVAITTSRRKSPLTNTFIKALARVMNAAIIRRGSSDLDEIAFNVKEAGLDGFLVVYTRKGNPSVITFYRTVPPGYFDLFGRLFILGVHINRQYKGTFEYMSLELHGESKGAKKVYEFLKEFLRPWKVVEEPRRYARFQIKDLEEFRESWLRKGDEKFEPAEIVVTDQRGEKTIFIIRVHHVWRSRQE